MEKTEVVICGAGTAGLALGLSLAKFGVKVRFICHDKTLVTLV